MADRTQLWAGTEISGGNDRQEKRLEPLQLLNCTSKPSKMSEWRHKRSDKLITKSNFFKCETMMMHESNLSSEFGDASFKTTAFHARNPISVN